MSHITTHPMPEDCVEKDESKVFTWCDIPLFNWEGWDILDTDNFVFYDCTWYSKNIMDAIEQYYMGHPDVPVKERKIDTEFRMDGWVRIGACNKMDENGYYDTYAIYEGFVSDMSYIITKLYEKWENIEKVVI